MGVHPSSSFQSLGSLIVSNFKHEDWSWRLRKTHEAQRNILRNCLFILFKQKT